MLKKHSELLVGALYICDMAVTATAWLLSYYLRFEIPAIVYLLPLPHGNPGVFFYLSALPAVLLACTFAYHRCRLYVPRREDALFAEIFDILNANLLSVALIATMLFVMQYKAWSRVSAGFFLLVNAGLLTTERLVVRSVLRHARARGWNLRHVVVVGAGKLGQELVERINRNPWIGLKVIGFIESNPDRMHRKFMGVSVIGRISDLGKIVRKHQVDQVFVALPFDEQERLKEVVEELSDEIVDLRIVPDFFSFATINAQIGDFDGLPIVSLRESPLHGWNMVAKRTMDIVVSVVVLTVMAFPMFLIGILIRLTSGKPVFYKQVRMGLDGRCFEIIKFRTMRADAEEATGAVWASEDDPRCTKIGKFLRKASLDELPQFFNVLRGEMSVVGPRPERPELIQVFRQSIPKYMLRHRTKAGITGWAQVHGWRGNTSLAKRIQYDLYYIENWSLWLDLWIILITPFTLSRNAC